MKLTVIALTTLAVGGMFASTALSQEKRIKIGVLEDQSGLYADATGAGSTMATRMAIEDSGLLEKGWVIDIVAADHQNRADVGSNLARQWFDADGVDAIVGLGSSSVSLAVSEIAKEKNKTAIVTSGGTSDLTGHACNANTVHWTYDTYALAKSTGSAITEAGGDSWFFIAADYAFGEALVRDTITAVEEAGGNIVGIVRHPLSAPDYSSYLLQAQASSAKVVAFANAGSDATNSIKQAAEFGLMSSDQTMAALLMFINDVHALGLPTAQGLNLTSTFYWDLNDDTRAFTARYAERMGFDTVPSMPQAGTYSGTLHLLKAAELLDGDLSDGVKVVEAMKQLPKSDPLFGEGEVRIDGRATHPVYLFKAKTPEESTSSWDLYELIGTVPGEEGFRPLDKGNCPLVGN